MQQTSATYLRTASTAYSHRRGEKRAFLCIIIHESCVSRARMSAAVQRPKKILPREYQPRSWTIQGLPIGRGSWWLHDCSQTQSMSDLGTYHFTRERHHRPRLYTMSCHKQGWLQVRTNRKMIAADCSLKGDWWLSEKGLRVDMEIVCAYKSQFNPIWSTQ